MIIGFEGRRREFRLIESLGFGWIGIIGFRFVRIDVRDDLDEI